MEIDSIPCLTFACKNNDLISLPLKLKPLKEKSLLYQVAQYYLSHQCPECIKSYFSRILNTNERLDTFLAVTGKSIINVLNACSGNIHVVYQIRQGEHPISKIQNICILFPWPLPTLRDIHYLELDASFDGMKP